MAGRSVANSRLHLATATSLSSRRQGNILSRAIAGIIRYIQLLRLIVDLDIYWSTAMLRIQPKWKLAAIATLVLAFCQAMPAHAQSAADCAARADRAERESNSVLGGAAVGAAGGAVFGAIVGDNRKATKRGAALGAVAGGATNAYRKNQTYKQVYDACMAGH
jgi:hypothetical protein